MSGKDEPKSRIKIVEGNIALLEVEAVVNAANKQLKLGGGVAGAIRVHGGPAIQEECDRLAPIEVGEAVITGGGQLKARFVIHAVGPVHGEGDEEAKLSQATSRCLSLAKEKKIRSLAMPAISTGVYGFPLQDCARIMLSVTLSFLRENEEPEGLVFCLYGEEAYSVFKRTLDSLPD